MEIKLLAPDKEIKKHVIITENEKEVRHLKKLFDKSYDEETFNKDFWEQPQQDFNKNWNWYFDENNNLSGASGHGEPEYTIKRLGRPVIYFSTLKMLFPTQADKVDAEDKEFDFSVWYINACEVNGIDPRERVPAHRIFNWFKDNFLSSQAQSKEGNRDKIRKEIENIVYRFKDSSYTTIPDELLKKFSITRKI